MLAQSKRHGFLAALLPIRRILVAVNKMDLVGLSEGVQPDCRRISRASPSKLAVQDIAFVQCFSTLFGDDASSIESLGCSSYATTQRVQRHVERTRNIDTGATS